MNQIIPGGPLPDAERERVDRIRKAKAAGTYEISAEVVAVKLVRLMLEIDDSSALHVPSSSSKARLHGGARSGRDKKPERDLHDDENAPAMLCASSDNANLPAGEHTRAIATRKTQCGDKTEEDAADQRQRDGEREDGAADADDGFGGKGIRRKQQGKLSQPVRRSNAKDGAGAGNDDGCDEQLADDAPATGADRPAATGQQRDGAIGSADDEQAHNAPKKKRTADRPARITW
jgi:hypothetical protein